MKACKFVILFAFCALAACAPQAAKESQGGAPVHQDEPPAGGRISRPPDNKNDCGARQMIECHLFGLDPQDLMTIREDIPFNVNSQWKAMGFSDEQIVQLRSARLGEWISGHYPKAKMDSQYFNGNEFLKFFNSIKW